MSAGTRRTLAALLAVVVVASAALAGVGGAQERTSDAPPADEIYVEDDGDAVLVYRSDDADGSTDAEFGVHVAEGLVYGLVEEPVEETPDVRGEFSTTAEPTSLQASGSLSAPRPPEVENFELEISGESTSETARSDFVLDATIVDESGLTQLVQSATTSGELTMSASRFRLSGEFEADTAMPVGEDAHVAATLREGEDAYTLSVEQDQPVGAFQADSWRNRSVAERTLRSQHEGIAASFGGNASVTIDSLSLSEAGGGSRRLDVEYTVSYEGIDDGIASMVRAALAEDPDVSADQADRLAREVRAATIREVSFSYDVTRGDPTASVTVDVAEFDGLVLAYFELAESLEADAGPAFGNNLEVLRKQFEAQAAAGLEQRTTWSGSLSHPDGETVRVEAEVHGRSDNWQAYVDELEARGVPRYDTVFEVSGSSDGDRISVEGSAELSGEDLFEQLLGQVHNATGGAPEAEEAVDALRDSEPRKAKLETSYDGDGFSLEFAAAFDDLAVLRDALSADYDAPRVTEAVTRPADGGSVAYVRASGAVDAGASEADVRALSVVGDDTAVHMPGEWDREFPSMDTERARSFLAADGSGGIVPGFGPVAALLALVAVALLAVRRR